MTDLTVPSAELVQCGTPSYVTKDAFMIWAESKGTAGFTVVDMLTEGLAKDKESARQKIKRFKRLIQPFGRHSPQRYYASSLIEDVKALHYGKTVPTDTTGITVNTTNLTQSELDEVINHGLESDVLPFLNSQALYIHRLGFELSLGKEHDVYPFLSGFSRITCKKAKVYEYPVDGHLVQFMIYPSGKVMVYSETSKHPHKLATEQDHSELIGFLGAIRQKLKDIVVSTHSHIVPPLTEWRIISSDLNLDPTTSSARHLSNNKLQVKHYDHLFRIYVKSLGSRTVRRIEKAEQPNRPALDYLQERFTMEGMNSRMNNFESHLLGLADELAKLKASREAKA